MTYLIPNPLCSAAIARPNHLALQSHVHGDGNNGHGIETTSYTFSQMLSAAICYAQQLTELGISKGDRVAWAADQSTTSIKLLHAIGILGAVAVPLDPNLTQSQLTHRAKVAHANIYVQDKQIRHWVNKQEISNTDTHDFAAKNWALPEPRLILFTSGSSGNPKCITLTTAQIFFSSMGSALRLGHHLSDNWLHCLPLHHVGGLSILFRSLFNATTVTLCSSFDVGQVRTWLDSGLISMVSLVPTMLQRVLDDKPNTPFSSHLRTLLLGGAPAAQSLLAECKAINAPIVLTWGMTETASQVATGFPGVSDDPFIPPLPFARFSQPSKFQTSNQNPKDVIKAPTKEGQHSPLPLLPIAIAGPLVPQPSQTLSQTPVLHQKDDSSVLLNQPLNEPHYPQKIAQLDSAPPVLFYSNDYGDVDHRGWVRVDGRLDRIILSGGENIDPAIIEQILLTHSHINDAAAVGESDLKWGQVAVAYVVIKTNHTLSEEILLLWCKQHLVATHVPKKIVFCTKIPRNTLGKLTISDIMEDNQA